MRYWLCVSGHHNWTVISQRNVWGVDDRYKLTIERNVSLEDELCFYVKPDRCPSYRNESRKWKSSITGIFRSKKHNSARDLAYKDDRNIGWVDPMGKPKAYPYRVDMEKVSIPRAPIVFNQQLKEELLFITDKSSSWGPFVFPSMVLLPKEDMETLKTWIQRTWE